MCCNAHSKADPANEAPSDHVDDTLVATPLPDGYWLHAFPFDSNSAFPDLLGYGLGFQDKSAAIRLLINPKNSGSGHFTETDHFQVMGLPIIPKSSDLTSPAPIIIYTPAYGEDPSQNIAFPSQFRLIHDAKLLPGTNSGLDMVLVAGREGIALLWFNNASKKETIRIGGSGSVDVVRVGDDPVGYIAACFHGNIVSVYTKPPHSTKGAASLKEDIWTRRVIDGFGPLNSAHTGTIHHVHAFHSGAFDSFGIACMGAPENQGVYVYTPTDKGTFKKTKVTEESAGRLAVASFTEANKEVFPAFYFEIASISYYVPGYHTGPDPPSVRINSVEQCNMASRTIISATKLNKEVLLHVPHPGHTLVVLRPDQEIKLEPSAGAKVIYGSIKMTTPNNAVVTRTIAPAVKETATTRPLSSDGTIKGGIGGAVFVLVEALDGHFQGPYRAMDQITTTNMFTQVPHVPANVKAMEFPFIKVEDLSWGDKHGDGLWNDFEFYNMTGFHIYFNDDTMEEICHIQAWTLGLGETARFHNHDKQSFCEIHYCLSTVAVRAVCDTLQMTIPKKSIRLPSSLNPMWSHAAPSWLFLPCSNTARSGKSCPTPNGRLSSGQTTTADYPWHAWLASEFGDRPLPIVPPLQRRNRYSIFGLRSNFRHPPSKSLQSELE
ncbi:hypothetical protein B0H14DRAFT_3112035 [Mycena olivaceomarginata]|nr:hypothetical protein B0H14DRAFT_3112035 [Mycena olivaceomarginata]